MGKDTKINEAKSLSTVNEQQKPRSAMSMSNQILSLDVKELRSLETIGISDPVENFKGKELNSKSIKRFKNELDILPDGRYQSKLPFKIKNSLASYKNVTWKRHQKMFQGIIETNCFDDYVSVFKEGENLGLIERVPE
ncbi:integrase catalytic domain-containing protein [Trichonephila inaurata madagascariensis]|uniref:Integrase catalytic domain-containing protein n=1 Tax=Trichonephila inaurata madagascariensis TaxID=2747483 RepID=A0A8X6X7L3_9ARAC|nr:integrase catalytic domain-containing protein [Trichonephila inaurata madagascariensis]